MMKDDGTFDRVIFVKPLYAENPFTYIHNALLRLINISPEALGVACYLHSIEHTSESSLMEHFRMDWKKLNSIIDELKGLGLIEWGVMMN